MPGMSDAQAKPAPPIDAEAFKRFEHAGWDQVGDRYHDAFGPLTRQAIDPTLDEAGVAKGTRLLDVACGPGYIAAAGARRGARAVGVDFSATMVGEAARLNPDVEFREGDAESLPFPDRSFDAVTIGFGMLHFARPERAAAEAFRVLVPGGRFAFTVWDAPERALTFGLTLRAIEARGNLEVPLPPGPNFFRFSDPAACADVLEGAGFRGPRVRTLPTGWRLPSVDALIEMLMTAGVRTRALLRAQTPEALAAIVTELRALARPYERAGGLELPTPCVLAAAARP